MNLYINILNINNLNSSIINDLDEYKLKTTNISLIFSENLILQNIDNCIYKINILDEPIKIINCEKYNIICDSSKFVKDGEYYQIPYNYLTLNTKKYYYQLRNNAIVNLVIEKNEKNDVVSCHFHTKECLITDSIIEDINSFLSLLKINL
tara:strand:+ start:106 stop:555 length:450 start_codon:yes stop_codon:yes gene_type:complete